MIYLEANIDKPILFSMCGNFTSDSKWIHMKRNLTDYEIIIVNKGTVYIQQNDSKYAAKEGDILLFTPDSIQKDMIILLKEQAFTGFIFHVPITII